MGPSSALLSWSAGTSAGQILGGSSVSVSWSATDADGDDLTYHVHYSSDGGTTYEAVGIGLTTSSLVLSRDRLAGSTRARFRVIASDGTRSATTESALFTVAESAPRVSLHSPNGGRVFGGPTTIVLDATARDAEDGDLDASSITWSSSIDGTLAANGYAAVDTRDLTPGTHVLTAAATDSSARSSSASVTVTVNADNDAPVARHDVIHAGASGIAAAAVVANDGDTERDIDPWTLRVVAPAALGAAGADAAVAPGVLEYRAAGAGVDVALYEVCDYARQCARAELVIVVLEDL